MASITTRAGKSSPLTHNEVDANFNNLNADKLDAAGIALGSAANPTIKFTGDPNTGIYSPGADQLAVSTGGTGRLFIASTGSVGIGTASPSAPLQVNGSVRVNAENSYLCVDNVEDRLGLVKKAGASPFFAAGSATSFIFSRSSGTDIASPATQTYSERMRLDSSGRLGLGTSTVEAAHILQANGVIATVTPFGAFSALQTAGGTGFRWTLANDGTYRLQRTTDGFSTVTTPIYVDSSSRVGIGTASPARPLDVNGSARVSDGAALEFGGVSTYIAGTSASNALLFNTSSSERVRLDSSGRLLVGTSTASDDIRAVFSGRSGSATGACFVRFSQGNTTPSNASTLGELRFTDSAAGIGASISTTVEGTWTSGTGHPTRLVFSTTADGAATPTERLRITSAGVLQVADASNITVGTTTGTKIGTGTTEKLGFYNATPVVQPTAVADATDAATVITQLNALLTRMRNLGLIAT